MISANGKDSKIDWYASLNDGSALPHLIWNLIILLFPKRSIMRRNFTLIMSYLALSHQIGFTLIQTESVASMKSSLLEQPV